jgi:hypothetical protein
MALSPTSKETTGPTHIMNTSIISTSKKKRTKKKKESVLAWLKRHISGLDLGMKVEKKNGEAPIHLNLNNDVIRFLKREKPFLNYSWNWAKLNHHFYDEQTYYFAGNSKRFQDTMAMIDVDCKECGTPEGAREFLDFLASDECREEWGLNFPRLYIETSTHGRGGHGFFILNKEDCTPEACNDLLLGRLVHWLNEIAASFDVEFVEVKGTMPVIQWGEKKGEVLGYKSGTLAKLPRQAESRFDDLRNTAKISVSDLLRLPIVKKKQAEPKLRVVGSSAKGSISGRHISDDMLDGLEERGRYRVLAERLSEHHELETSGRQKAVIEDKAIALMIGQHFTKNMNANGSLPVARWKGMWTSLFEAGDIDRAWDHHRFAAIRDWLDSLGLINWEDHEYTVGWHDQNGKYHKGKACKWRFSAELIEALDSVETETNDDVAVDVDRGEEKGHPLWEHKLTKWIKSIVPKDERAIVRPVHRALDGPSAPWWRYSPEDLVDFVTPFEVMAA